MRFKTKLVYQPLLGPIDIIPLIIILSLLGLIFILILPFLSSSGMKVALPKVITADLVQEENLVVIISAEDIIYFEGKVTSIEDLRNPINQAARQNKSLLIRADKRASLGRISELWQLCRGLGISNINIATN